MAKWITMMGVQVFLVVSFSCAGSKLNENYRQDNNIYGKWVSAERTVGGLGGILIFKPNGEMLVLYGAIIDYDYFIDDDKIVESFDDKRDIYHIQIDRDKLIKRKEIDGTGSSSIKYAMQRIEIDKIDPDSIVGHWIFKHSSGIGLQEYSDNGKAKLCFPLVARSGNYLLGSGVIKMEFGHGQIVSQKFRLEANSLILIVEKNEREDGGGPCC